MRGNMNQGMQNNLAGEFMEDVDLTEDRATGIQKILRSMKEFVAALP